MELEAARSKSRSTWPVRPFRGVRLLSAAHNGRYTKQKKTIPVASTAFPYTLPKKKQSTSRTHQKNALSKQTTYEFSYLCGSEVSLSFSFTHSREGYENNRSSNNSNNHSTEKISHT